ncbi:mitogen-activated protein kinase [Sporothrix epigloea]|uniref:cyclin-dependent kinase n=1 Tax=Sporothrix epigloea TaxID=1892477 RepID=A0ABP0D6L9_9PEZI
MSTEDNWRRTLTATERFSNIQSIEKNALPSALLASAYNLENDAFTSSASREDYDAACRLLSAPPGSSSTDSRHLTTFDDSIADVTDSSGRTIGVYENCRYLASGTSADVYRSGSFALKVCTIGHNCPPHNVYREAKILKQLQQTKTCVIQLLETFHDAQQQLVLVCPYMPLTLQAVLLADRGIIPRNHLQGYFVAILSALASIHSQGIIHRDVKPSAVLLSSIDGPAYLSDFGTAWHPALSKDDEPADNKVLDIGTGPYRAPEVLFGNQAYNASVDMWAMGAVLAECACPAPHKTLFDSRAVHEDGNQLGLILSIFKTIGTPNRESWPEAASFRTPPFDIYRVFERQSWESILPDVDEELRDIVAALVKYDSTRLTADEALIKMQNLKIEQA